MKAIKINPCKRTITYIDIDSYGEIKHNLNENCKNFICPMIFETLDTMYVDYYAPINARSQNGFLLDGWNHPVIGNAIIIGTNSIGDLDDIKIDIEHIESKISFVSNNLLHNWLFNNINLEHISFSKN
jgi:hypothetical protein